MAARRLLGAAILLLTLCAVAAPATAHTKSETHSSWEISGSNVHVEFMTPDVEAKRLTGDGSLPDEMQLERYLAARLGATAGGKPCPMSDLVHPLSASAGFRRMEFSYLCPSSRDIRVFSHAFFDRVPTHVTFAQIHTSDGQFFEQLLTKDMPTLGISGNSAENRLRNASFVQYIQMGVMHIFTGIDHMSFLVGLVLISRRLRDLTFVITGFTLGHSCTLALAVTGILRPHAEFIDALVALTIALIGAENIAVATHKPALVSAGAAGLLLAMAVLRLFGIGVLPILLIVGAGFFSANYLLVSGYLRDAGRLRLLVTLVFGLIHGFGFASGLLEMKLPESRLIQLLLGFNVGVEIGQLTLVLGLVAAVYILSRLKLALPRPVVVDVTASGLISLGTYWFITRSF